MRKRTADFLQGEWGQLSLLSYWILTRNSAQQSSARERGAGKEDGQWPDIPGPELGVLYILFLGRGAGGATASRNVIYSECIDCSKTLFSFFAFRLTI